MSLFVIILILLLFLSGIFSGSETAIFSMNPAQIAKLKSKKSPLLKPLIYLVKFPERTMSALLLGNLAVNMGLSHTGNIFLKKLSTGKGGDLVALTAITIILLIFGEIIPKILALRYAEKWSQFFSRFIYLFIKIFSFIIVLIEAFTRLIDRIVPKKSKGHNNEVEILDAIDYASSEGILSIDEKTLLSRTVNFYHDVAGSLMIPRNRILSIPRSMELETARKEFQKTNSSYAVVYSSGHDNVMGYIHLRNLLSLTGKQGIKNGVQGLLFYPKTIKLTDLLNEFIKHKSEVAAILDEMGEFSGIITMKQIFDSLLGNLREEFSEQEKFIEEKLIEKIRTNLYKVMGKTPLNELNTTLKIDLTSQTSDTVSGFIIEKLDGFPRKNTRLKIENVELYNMKMKNNVIEEVTVKINHDR